MTEKLQSPIRPTDNEARQLAKDLMADARVASLGVLQKQTRHPFVTRIAIATAEEGWPISLVSDLSIHTQALRENPQCSLLLGEVDGPQTTQKGDPLNQPRLTILAQACFVTREAASFKRLQEHYLQKVPKAQIYANFGDFNFVMFEVHAAFLNGGFGKAFQLKPEDLGLTK